MGTSSLTSEYTHPRHSPSRNPHPATCHLPVPTSQDSLMTAQLPVGKGAGLLVIFAAFNAHSPAGGRPWDLTRCIQQLDFAMGLCVCGKKEVGAACG